MAELRQIDMNIIEKALMADDRFYAMKQLNFELLPQDKEKPDDYFFMRKDNSLIVFFSAINAVFYTYPKANRRSLI